MIFYAIILIIVVRFFLRSDPPKIAGAYSQPGKWYTMKYWLFHFLMKLRQRKSRQQATVSGTDAGYGMRSRSSVEDMDRVQDLPKEHPQAVDAVYFNGASENGQYFVGATARRHDNLVQTLLYIRMPEVGLLELPSLPDTCLSGDKLSSYAAGGFLIEVIEPMKRWRLSYDGPMRLIGLDGSITTATVSFGLDWIAYTRHFDFDTDLNPRLLCDAIATEPWSREFFNNLKVAHQTHYEQFGELSGTIKIENHGEKEIKVQGVRDHSYGNIRDWRDLHRYAIQYIHLEDGKAMCVGNICMPRTVSRLIIGYIFHPDGRMDRVKSCDLYLHALGEDGKDPTDFEINFTSGDDDVTYCVEGHVVDRPIFYMGWEWESRIHERFCTFKVNGVKGWGVSEWCYRNHSGRPESYKAKELTDIPI